MKTAHANFENDGLRNGKNLKSASQLKIVMLWNEKCLPFGPFVKMSLTMKLYVHILFIYLNSGCRRLVNTHVHHQYYTADHSIQLNQNYLDVAS